MKSLRNFEFGCPSIHISNLYGPLDFIEYFDRRSPRIIEKIGSLYLNGLSITEIHRQTGIPRSTVYASIRTNRHKLRPPPDVPYTRWRRGNPKPRRNPPYGYGWLSGELVKDPKEYPIVQLIESLWKQGRSVGEIVRYLNGRGYRSRLGRDWGYGVIKRIFRRINNIETKSE